MNNIVKQLDLPIYRGKSIKTKQYVEGYLKTCTDTGANVYWIQTKDWIDYQIDPEPLSISFPNMRDSNSDRVFASLAKSGKGGDILEVPYEVNGTEISFTVTINDINLEDFTICKIIGIQE